MIYEAILMTYHEPSRMYLNQIDREENRGCDDWRFEVERSRLAYLLRNYLLNTMNQLCHRSRDPSNLFPSITLER